MTKFRATLLLITPISLCQYSAFSLGDDEAANWLRLQRLNQQSQQQLELIHRQFPPVPPAQPFPLDPTGQRLQAQQQSGLSQLQEQQRRKQIVDGHRHRIFSDGARAEIRQRIQLQQMRNSQNQRNLLNRYRMQYYQYRFAH
ncbi:MAG: hypothetical protein P8098_06350 [Candidatus Thiodiazotropha sp.]